MSNEDTNKSIPKELPAEVLDATGQILAVGQARLVPETNFGTFVPEDLGNHVDSLLLGPSPTALRFRQGPVFRVNSFKRGEGNLVEKYFVFRQYGTVGS